MYASAARDKIPYIPKKMCQKKEEEKTLVSSYQLRVANKRSPHKNLPFREAGYAYTESFPRPGVQVPARAELCEERGEEGVDGAPRGLSWRFSHLLSHKIPQMSYEPGSYRPVRPFSCSSLRGKKGGPKLALGLKARKARRRLLMGHSG